MELNTFRYTYPEMGSVDDPLLVTYLARAASHMDPVVFGSLYDDAHGLLTAHLLAISPYGKNARLQSDKGKTTYGSQYDEIRYKVTSGLGRVV